MAWIYIEVTNLRLAIEVYIYKYTYHEVHEHFEITSKCKNLPPTSVFECAVSANVQG